LRDLQFLLEEKVTSKKGKPLFNTNEEGEELIYSEYKTINNPAKRVIIIFFILQSILKGQAIVCNNKISILERRSWSRLNNYILKIKLSYISNQRNRHHV
jgi:hypothetical protein